MNSSCRSTEDSFDSFVGYLKDHLEKMNLKDDGVEEIENPVQNFDKDLHWNKLGLCFQAVSKECTKLAVGYSKPPAPNKEECSSLISSVKEAVNVLLAWYETFPYSQGKALCLELKKLVFCLLEAVQDLILSVESDGCSELPDRLQKTGKVWKLCEAFVNISKDNKLAAESRLAQSYQLVDDALNEIEEEIATANENSPNDDNEDDTDDENWKEEDKPLLQPCLGLMKAGKKTIKMIKNSIQAKGDGTALKCIGQLDKTVELTDKISPSVDDLVLSLYPPIDHSLTIENAMVVANSLDECLHLATEHHYTDECDSQWLDFIETAVNHNVKKLCNLQKT